MVFRKTGGTYIVRLDRGEEIVSSLLSFAEKENITAASITALGAADYVEAGLYSLKEQRYHSKVYEGEYEITALIGNLSKKDGKPHLHLHITIADENGSCFGGHLNNAKISATCEMFIRTYPFQIGRTADPETGLNLFSL